ncbi:MAG: ATP synthase gamma chain, partial [uncultured Gemmatimonadaceae bacterium]
GQGAGAQGADQERREHAQDHAHHGDGRDVQDEAGAGPRGGGSPLRVGARRGDLEPLLAGVGRAVPAAAAARARAAGCGAAAHVEPGARGRVQREPHQGGARPAAATRAGRRGGGLPRGRPEGARLLPVRGA